MTDSTKLTRSQQESLDRVHDGWAPRRLNTTFGLFVGDELKPSAGDRFEVTSSPKRKDPASLVLDKPGRYHVRVYRNEEPIGWLAYVAFERAGRKAGPLPYVEDELAKRDYLTAFVQNHPDQAVGDVRSLQGANWKGFVSASSPEGRAWRNARMHAKGGRP